MLTILSDFVMDLLKLGVFYNIMYTEHERIIYTGRLDMCHSSMEGKDVVCGSFGIARMNIVLQ